jgi:hypothetical protein
LEWEGRLAGKALVFTPFACKLKAMFGLGHAKSTVRTVPGALNFLARAQQLLSLLSTACLFLFGWVDGVMEPPPNSFPVSIACFS